MSHPLWIILPVPPVIQVQVIKNPKEDRKRLDNYVKEFVVPHGYKITISHSSNESRGICHYECHRSGHPARPKSQQNNINTPSCSTNPNTSHVTRSIKIQCPFRLTAKFEESTNTWDLQHVRIGHNHGPADTSVAVPPVPTIVYPHEINSRVTRILQLSPRRQNIVLQGLDELLDQNSAVGLVTSPLMNNGADSDDNEVALALKTLDDLDESDECGTEEQVPMPVNQAHPNQDHVVDQPPKRQESIPTNPAAQGDESIPTDQLTNKAIAPQDQVDVLQAQVAITQPVLPVVANRIAQPNLLQVEEDKLDETPVGQTEQDADKEEEPIGTLKKNTRTKRASSSTTSKEGSSQQKNKKKVKCTNLNAQEDMIPAPRTTRSCARRITPAARSTRCKTRQKT
ncbi:hypothetical protein DFH28DRAFT_998129 [Melampsora americana]|nr:hypothetical protein DFH28DRAFT_1007233 [Melampsora americana]KAH9807944.1 hypothetical protein DFH28DRAFT_1000731 [Melampsora americana]KAH9808115.1 hypothetical protein DFH28DRAFT_998291 [Melampsora americana]KAH9808160.1 hypothetical protein DFH28DRAFT_998129 [Melampsora americana]